MITRRGVLGLMGGLPFTRPDQHYEPPGGAIVPGARSTLTVKKVTIIAGAGGGLFVYSGAPAAGTLIATIAATAGTDPYGNQYLTGIAAYAPGSSAMQILNGQLNTYTFSAGWVFDDSFTGSIINLQSAEQFFLKFGAFDAFDVTNALADFNVALNISAAASASPVVNITNSTAAPSNDTLRVNPAGSADKAIGVRVTGETNDRWLVQTNATPGATLFFGPGTSGADISLLRAAANQLNLHTADLDIDSAGRGLRVAEGSNAKQGTATLAAGTVTVANTSVTANSRIFLTAQNSGAAPGALRVSARTAGTSFTITSTSGTDTSLVAWEIFEPG